LLWSPQKYTSPLASTSNGSNEQIPKICGNNIGSKISAQSSSMKKSLFFAETEDICSDNNLTLATGKLLRNYI